MSKIIKIEESTFNRDNFTINVSFDNTGQRFTTQLKNPYDKEIEKHFEWYFEEYIREPYIPAVTVEKPKQDLVFYGENLFKGVLASDSDIYSNYRSFIQNNDFKNIIIEIVGDSTVFHSIHWESLKDPDFSEPLAAKGAIFYRKNQETNLTEVNMNKSPFINLLIITARPNEEDDINYRTIQRPLIKAIKSAKLRVKPHILRPGTFGSLTDHLKQVSKGFYHIIHFDLHGSLLDYISLKEAAINGTMDIHSREGLELVQPYGGKKNFIFFESDEKGVSIPVEACEIANLLTNKQIPVCIFNACQSAKQDNIYTETGFGRELLKEDIQIVLAMRYSISVTAAELLMKKLYSELFSKKSIEASIASGRQELYAEKKRNAWLGHVIELDDWLLPIVYKNRDVDFNLREFTKDEEKQFNEKEEKRHQYYPPKYDFHGRDLDILKIEKQLLKYNQLLLQGMGGAGKTTLLNYLAWWWQETGFIDHVFYFPYDQRAWTVEQIIFEIAKTVISAEDFNRFQIKSMSEQKQELLSLLNCHRHALILDNTESVTGEELAIPNILTESERQELKEFLSQIKEKTFVILGSRSDESWIKAQTFQNNVFILRGFDKETTFNFAQKILTHLNLNIEKMIQNSDFNRLLKLLSGYPLALHAILPNLRTHSPSQIIHALQSGNVELDRNNPQQKEKSIIYCIEYAYKNLSEDSQELLLFFAPFQSTINLKFINLYFEEIKKKDIFIDCHFDKINLAIKEASQNGFMQETSPLAPFQIDLQPVFTFFLKRKLSEKYGRDFIGILDTAFINYYTNFSHVVELELLSSQNVTKQQIGILLIELEYENLLTALEMSIRNNEIAMYTYNAIIKFLEKDMKYQEILSLSKRILKRFNSIPTELLNGEILKEFIGVIDMIGNTYAKMNNLEEAEKYFARLVDIYEDDKIRETISQYMGGIFLNMGAVFRSSKDWQKSKNYLDKALDIFIESKNEIGQANVYQNLGVLSKIMENYEESWEYFSKALKIYSQNGARKYQANIYENLGDLARILKKYEKSIYYFERAGKIYIKINEINSLGTIYLNLAKLKLESKKYQDSIDFYKKALEVFIPLKDEYRQVQIYLDMGRVELSLFQTYLNQKKINLALQKLQESMGYFQKSIEIAAHSGNKELQRHAEKQAQIIVKGVLKVTPEILKFSAAFLGDLTKELLKKLPEK